MKQFTLSSLKRRSLSTPLEAKELPRTEPRRLNLPMAALKSRLENIQRRIKAIQEQPKPTFQASKTSFNPGFSPTNRILKETRSTSGLSREKTKLTSFLPTPTYLASREIKRMQL